jgi:hypothetical protein
MTSKFEQLIEYVINDEEQKARELFHDIVVEKSREIYENLMNEEEEEMDESKHDKMDADEEELDEAKNEEGEELDEAMHDEELDEGLGGDAADDLIDDVEMDEAGMEMAEGEGEEGLEDRVVDLEDKLDELMAEFEAMMGGDNEAEADDFGAEGGDELEMDDTEEFTSDDGSEEDSEEIEFMEGVDLKAAPKPVTSEEGGTNTKSTVAANAGAAGAVAKPVSTTGAEAKGRPAPSAKDMGGTTSPKQGPATKPVTTQAAGVNTKSPLPRG